MTAPNCCRRPWAEAFPGHAACPSTVSPPLHIAYAAWVEHHAACPVCSREDWFMPGGTIEVPEGPLAEGKVVAKVNGTEQTIYFRRGPDTGLLCRTGATLFKNWCTLAARQNAFALLTRG
jgi:hypothetical protein